VGERDPPFEATPSVARAIGLERDPVDLSNRDDRDWLRALIWPNDLARLARFERAAALARAHPSEIRKGNALELLTDALADVPTDAIACVYLTITTYQFSRALRETLEAILTVGGVRRPVQPLQGQPGPEQAGGVDVVTTGVSQPVDGGPPGVGRAVLQRKGVEVGPVISESQLKKITGYIEQGKKEARLLVGGQRLTDGELAKGNFLAPAVFDGVAPDARISQEEIFGPVMGITTFKDLDDAIGSVQKARAAVIAAAERVVTPGLPLTEGEE